MAQLYSVYDMIYILGENTMLVPKVCLLCIFGHLSFEWALLVPEVK